MTNFPFSKALFWDININEINLSTNKDFIIERVLVRGGRSDVKKITSLYTKDELLKAIKKNKRLDKVTHNFCANYFNIPKTSMHAPSQYY